MSYYNTTGFSTRGAVVNWENGIGRKKEGRLEWDGMGGREG